MAYRCLTEAVPGLLVKQRPLRAGERKTGRTVPVFARTEMPLKSFHHPGGSSTTTLQPNASMMSLGEALDESAFERV